MADSGIDFSYLLAIFEDVDSNVPPPELAGTYHESIGSPDYPVLSDTNEQIVNATPFAGAPVPGKCALSPDMVILDCMTGHGVGNLFELIEQHAASR